MVSGRRPLWIHRIEKRVSLPVFKKIAQGLKRADEDIRYVLKGKPNKYVYKVTVETMEGCGDNPFEEIWVPDELAKGTGEMLDMFEDQLEVATPNPADEISEPSAKDLIELDRVYEKLCSDEKFEPYENDTDDTDEWLDEWFDEDDDVELELLKKQ